MPEVERSLVLIKPDAVASGWTEEIVKHYEAAGLTVVRRREAEFNKAEAQMFYREHEGKIFFIGLRLAMTSGPLVALELQGENAITKVRDLNGPTDPSEAPSTTIRGKFKSCGGPFNTVHGSDSIEAAEREISQMEGWGIFQ